MLCEANSVVRVGTWLTLDEAIVSRLAMNAMHDCLKVNTLPYRTCCSFEFFLDKLHLFCWCLNLSPKLLQQSNALSNWIIFFYSKTYWQIYFTYSKILYRSDFYFSGKKVQLTKRLATAFMTTLTNAVTNWQDCLCNHVAERLKNNWQRYMINIFQSSETKIKG